MISARSQAPAWEPDDQKINYLTEKPRWLLLN
jgi:hypothetical protein